LIAGISTLIARSIEHRSIYDAKLTDEEIAERLRLREQPTV
jgi:chloride channel protein, CIC family